MSMGRARGAAWLALLAAALPACSIKGLAVNSLGNALSEGGASYARDDDPELVFAASPFALKTVESLLDEAPRHKGLLTTASSGFVQYAFGQVQQEADFVEAADLARATVLRARAKRLYLRGRDYGFRGLEVDFPRFREELARDPRQALAPMTRAQVPLLYWTSLAWFAAISLDKTNSELAADQFRAEALMRRALALDEGWERGSIHDFLISWEGRGEAVGGSYERARRHLERARELAQNKRASALVNYAETVSVARQDRKEFEALLREALAVDPDVVIDMRLANVLYQRRARWLLGRADELFVE
jgi:predicted anti-sigma-YlaC factor YlaD